MTERCVPVMGVLFLLQACVALESQYFPDAFHLETQALLHRTMTDGDFEAQLSLGEISERGQGLTKDCVKAAEWYI